MQLKIDTTQSKKVRVEICDNLSKIKDSLFITRKSGSQSLLPAIAKILKKNKKTLSDIKAVEVNTGPGSFTGTRVGVSVANRSEEHTSELQSQSNLVCRLLLEKK